MRDVGVERGILKAGKELARVRGGQRFENEAGRVQREANIRAERAQSLRPSGVHRVEEFAVRLRALDLVEQEFDRIGRAHRIQDTAQDSGQAQEGEPTDTTPNVPGALSKQEADRLLDGVKEGDPRVEIKPRSRGGKDW